MTKTNVSKEEEIFNEEVKEWVEETQTPRYAYLRAHLLGILKSLNLKKKNILELGCGISPYLEELEGNKLYGLDISQTLLKMNKCKKAVFVRGDVLKCSRYFHKKFDLVFMAGVMHHIKEKDHETALKEISKLLKKGGKLIILEPNMVSITGIFYILRKTAEKILPKKTLTKIAGFSSEEEKYIFPSRFKKLLKKDGFILLDSHSIGLIRLPPLKILKKIPVERLNKKIDFLLKKLRIDFGATIVFISKK